VRVILRGRRGKCPADTVAKTLKISASNRQNGSPWILVYFSAKRIGEIPVGSPSIHVVR